MYAYKPIERDEKGELNKIGSRVADFNNVDRRRNDVAVLTVGLGRFPEVITERIASTRNLGKSST